MIEKYRHPQISSVGLVAWYKLWAGALDGKLFDYSLNGYEGEMVNGTGVSGALTYPGIAFNGTDSELVITSGPSKVGTIIIWIKPDAVTAEEIIDLNNVDFIDISAGDIAETGFAGGTVVVYVDAVVGTVVDTEWHMVTLTDTVGKDASAGNMKIGNTAATNLFDGKIGETMLYDRVLTPAEVKSIYELTKWRYTNY